MTTFSRLCLVIVVLLGTAILVSGDAWQRQPHQWTYTEWSAMESDQKEFFVAGFLAVQPMDQQNPVMGLSDLLKILDQMLSGDPECEIGAALQKILQPIEPPALLVELTSKVAQGSTARITIMGDSNVSYLIEIQYKSGVSRARGLGPKESDSEGRVFWEWTVGARTEPGIYPIRVIDSRTKAVVVGTVFEVVEN